jgi:hypothetical protein
LVLGLLYTLSLVTLSVVIRGLAVLLEPVRVCSGMAGLAVGAGMAAGMAA